MPLSPAQSRSLGILLIFAFLAGIVAILLHQISTPSRIVTDPAPISKPHPPSSNSAPFSAQVVDAADHPVANALVLASTTRERIDLFKNAPASALSARTDNDGNFTFPHLLGWTDLVVRCDAGYARVPMDNLPADCRIVLQSWDRVEDPTTIPPPLKIPAAAPDLQAIKSTGTRIKLADFRGQYILLAFFHDAGPTWKPDPQQVVRWSAALRDRFDDDITMLAIMPLQSTPSAAAVSLPGWITATRDSKEPIHSPGAVYLIDPTGTPLAISAPYGSALYGIADTKLGFMRRRASGVIITMEKLVGAPRRILLSNPSPPFPKPTPASAPRSGLSMARKPATAASCKRSMTAAGRVTLAMRR